MDDDPERLNRLLDDLAAERDPRDRAELSAANVDLAQTAAFLKAAHGERSMPTEEFVERLGGQLAAASSAEEHAQRAGSAPVPGLSRRGLLGRLGAGVAGLVVGMGAGAAVGTRVSAEEAYERGKHDGYLQEVRARFRAPLVPADRGQWLDTGHSAGGVRSGQAVRFRVGVIEGFLVNPGNGGAIYALSAACTHMGCLISWLDSAGSFLCPCHGAQYNADGTVLSGIARQPLPHLRVRVGTDGHVYVWAVTEHPTVTTLAPYTDS
jgi:cytochrome b6-f complex iron-sulfur subunit